MTPRVSFSPIGWDDSIEVCYSKLCSNGNISECDCVLHYAVMIKVLLSLSIIGTPTICVVYIDQIY